MHQNNINKIKCIKITLINNMYQNNINKNKITCTKTTLIKQNNMHPNNISKISFKNNRSNGIFS